MAGRNAPLPRSLAPTAFALDAVISVIGKPVNRVTTVPNTCPKKSCFAPLDPQLIAILLTGSNSDNGQPITLIQTAQKSRIDKWVQLQKPLEYRRSSGRGGGCDGWGGGCVFLCHRNDFRHSRFFFEINLRYSSGLNCFFYCGLKRCFR